MPLDPGGDENLGGGPENAEQSAMDDGPGGARRREQPLD